jgi:hypothetical protein
MALEAAWGAWQPVTKVPRPVHVPTASKFGMSSTMPATIDVARRDRALIAFTILTGARDGATASFKLRHIDIAIARAMR